MAERSRLVKRAVQIPITKYGMESTDSNTRLNTFVAKRAAGRTGRLHATIPNQIDPRRSRR